MSPDPHLDSPPERVVSGIDPYATARALMVDGQVRPNQVNDARIVEAMRAIRRERFVPADQRALAYRDGDVPLGDGRFLTEPRVIARLLQAARVREGQRVLVVGSATGYVAVLLAWLGARVVALESEASFDGIGASLAADASVTGTSRPLGEAIVWRRGPLARGAVDLAPFDVILIDGAVAAVPESLERQLVPHGRLLATIAIPGQVPYVAMAEASGAGLRPVPLFDASTRGLAELLPAPGFVF